MKHLFLLFLPVVTLLLFALPQPVLAVELCDAEMSFPAADDAALLSKSSEETVCSDVLPDAESAAALSAAESDELLSGAESDDALLTAESAASLSAAESDGGSVCPEAGEAIGKVFLTMIGATAVGVFYSLMWIVAIMIVVAGFPLVLLLLLLLDRYTPLSIPRKKRLLWSAVATVAALLIVAFIYFDIAYISPRRMAAEAPSQAVETIVVDSLAQ